tara:strand:+ start:991 stop:1473 length:483 start_codon:yes stop_codon:yes gene_type:complete
MVFADDMADDRNLHEVRLSYNRMASLLVFIANAFTLMYIGNMSPEDSIWYGAVSGSFTFAILTNASLTAERLDDFRRAKSDRAKEKSKPMGMPMMPQMFPQMMPQQQMMQQPPQQQMQQQQQPMQPVMKQQNFTSSGDEKEYVDPRTGEIKPIQEAEMLD